LICLSAFVATADGSNPPKTYSITPYDADARLVFTLTDQKSHNWIDLFTSPTARAAVGQWQAVSDTPVNQEDVERQTHLLTLLYWQSCFPNSSAKVLDLAKAPHSEIDVQEANKLLYAPAGLPTEVLRNAFNKDSHWYQAALQQILTAEKDPQDQENTEPLKKIIEGTGQARDVFTRVAESFDQQAATGGVNAAHLKAEAAGFRVLAGSVTLIKDQNAFKFKISAALCKRLPHMLFSAKGAKTVALPLDKALILIQLASTFNQKMAVSSEKARQLAAVLDYASANHVPLNADFVDQSRALCAMAGHLDLVLVATFLDTTVDWVKRTAVTTTPSAMAALSQKLAAALADAAPDQAGYFSTFASTVVDRFSLLFAADAGANLLFNTSGTYGSIKTAEFCYDCAQQLDNIGGAAHSQLSNSRPSANSLTSWAMAGYFREVAVSAYHQDYADLLQGGRVATWVANLVTSGGPEASIDYHNKVAHQVGDGADEWVHPVVMGALLKLYRPSTVDQSASGVASGGIQLPLISHGNGFADHADLTTNGSAAFRASQLIATRISAVLTDGSVQAGSLFSSEAVDISHFATQFVFKLSGGSTSFADGITFTIQANGPTSLGGAGGSLGYGDEQGAVNLSNGIRRSVAVKFDTYDDFGEGNNSTGLFTNGKYPSVPSNDLTPTSIDLHSGDPFRVSMIYDGSILKVVLTDTKTKTSAKQNYRIDIPSTLGGTKAYIGFTGGTGENYSVQEVYSWNFFSLGTVKGIPAPTLPPARQEP